MNSISFIVCSLLYSILLIVLNFRKKSVVEKVNKICSALIISNFIGLLLEIINYFTVKKINQIPIINFVVSKAYLIYLLTWILLLTFYTFTISYKKEGKQKNKIEKDYNKTKKIFLYFYFVYALIVIFLPISFSTKIGAIYSYGPSVQSIFLISEVCIALCWVFMFKNIKEIRTKKYAPLFIFFVGGLTVMLIQSYYPQLLLSTSMETFVTFLIYFTIEKPNSNKKITNK